MAEVSEDGGALSSTRVASNGHSTFLDWTPTAMQPAPLKVSRLFKEGKSSSRRRTSVRPSLDANKFINLLHGSDPIKVELNQLENEVRGVKCGSIRCVSSLILLALISV